MSPPIAHPPIPAALTCGPTFPLELLGGELGTHIDANTPADCCAACSAHVNCAAWTWYPARGEGDTRAAGTCMLLSDVDWTVLPAPPGVVSSLMAPNPAAMGEACRMIAFCSFSLQGNVASDWLLQSKASLHIQHFPFTPHALQPSSSVTAGAWPPPEPLSLKARLPWPLPLGATTSLCCWPLVRCATWLQACASSPLRH